MNSENKTIKIRENGHDYYREDKYSNYVTLAHCIKCKKRRCKRKDKLAEILFDTIDRILSETDVREVGSLTLYNIFKPNCKKIKEIK